MTLQILTLVLVALALAPAMAHAFEYPRKKRLSKDVYLAVQAIYYPGFTLLGFAEVASLIALAIHLAMMPAEGLLFRLTLMAFTGMVGMQVLYWMFNHPANKYWLKGGNVTLGAAGSGFFGTGAARTGEPDGGDGQADWRKLRDRWEFSHIARAGMAFLSFLCLALALAHSPAPGGS